jgi:acetyltransferase-like isoleucine patch superfamily enzyme
MMRRLKEYLKLTVIYPRRYPGCRIESIVPSDLDIRPGTIIRSRVTLSPSLELIGRHAYLGEGAAILECREIGDFSCVSQGARVGLADHALDHVGTSHLFSSPARGWVEEDTRGAIEPATIGADVLLSANVLVLAGVTIGHGAVIGAGAVVTEDIPPFAIAVGVPARVTGHRFDEGLRERLLASRWWERDDGEIRKLREHFRDPERFLKGLPPT